MLESNINLDLRKGGQANKYKHVTQSYLDEVKETVLLSHGAGLFQQSLHQLLFLLLSKGGVWERTCCHVLTNKLLVR